VHKALKNRIINLIELLPFGHDIYLQMAKKRLGITYRGVFDSFSEAHARATNQIATDYDVINTEKGKNLDQELPTIEKKVLDTDYPLLFWLARLIEASHRILDLGGSIGQSFYSFENYFPYPDNIKWVVSELPGAVEIGQKVAKQRGEERLAFVDSNHMDLEKADIFMTAGTIQYMDTTISEVLRQLSKPPVHVLIHNIPVHSSDDFWTLQNLKVCEVPYHIHSMAGIVSNLENTGYRLMDRWEQPRQIEIPYHPKNKVENYFGFYLKLIKD